MRLNTSTLRGLSALCLLTAMLPLGPCAAQGAPGFRPGTPDRVCLAMRARAQQVGQPAADIRGVDQNGAAMDLAQLKGKVILLDVSAMWCVWCQVDAPALEKLYQTYGPKGLAVVTCLTEDTPAGLPTGWRNRPT
jgi:thiol-disulfide isomerase/thioredoxin